MVERRVRVAVVNRRKSTPSAVHCLSGSCDLGLSHRRLCSTRFVALCIYILNTRHVSYLIVSFYFIDIYTYILNTRIAKRMWVTGLEISTSSSCVFGRRGNNWYIHVSVRMVSRTSNFHMLDFPKTISRTHTHLSWWFVRHFQKKRENEGIENAATKQRSLAGCHAHWW